MWVGRKDARRRADSNVALAISRVAWRPCLPNRTPTFAIYQQLALNYATVGDAGLGALAPALRRRPALLIIGLMGNPFGDEGLAALVAPPPPPAGAPPLPTGVLAKLKELVLLNTQVTDAGCAALAAALDGGALPALERLFLDRIPFLPAAHRKLPCTRH
jgi:hypothetical protein